MGASALARGSVLALLGHVVFVRPSYSQETPAPPGPAVAVTPTVVITRDRLLASGAPSVGELLRQLPESGGALNRFASGGSDGQTLFALRSLGSKRTLVLVDGVRMPRGGWDMDGGVDLDGIPMAMVERIEILKGGTTAQYGDGAVAGVVNIITRKTLDGYVSGSAYVGTSQHRDATVTTLEALGGVSGEKGSALIGVSRSVEDSLATSQRGWAAHAKAYDFATGQVRAGGSGLTPLSQVYGVNPTTCTTQLCTDLVAAFPGQTRLNLVYDPGQSLAGATYVSGWRLRDPSVDVYDTRALAVLATPAERTTVFASGDYQLPKEVRLHVQGMWGRRSTTTREGPFGFSSLTTGLMVSGANPYNPFGQTVAASLALGPTTWDGNAETQSYRVVAGLDGRIASSAGPTAWTWTASFDLSRTSGTRAIFRMDTTMAGVGIGPAFVDGTSNYHCGTTTSVLDFCTPVNLFGGAGAITPGMGAQLGLYSTTREGWDRLWEVHGGLRGPLFTLLADRPVMLSLAYTHRDERALSYDVPLLVAGWNTDITPLPDVSGRERADEVFASVVVPVVEHVAVAHELTVEAEGRASHLGTLGWEGAYRVGGRWSPVESVTLRSSFGTTFRAPSILEQHQNAVGAYEPVSDPCAGPLGAEPDLAARCGSAAGNGMPGTGVAAIQGGNAALRPETAKSFGLGVVFELSFVQGLSVSLDYYRISISHVIGVLGAQYIADKCYGAGTAQDVAYCDLITRDTAGANPTYAITRVFDLNTDVGSVETSGLDLGATYALPTPVGRVSLRLDATYLLTRKTTRPDGSVVDGAGNYDGNGTVAADGTNLNPRLRFGAVVGYELEGLSAALSARYIGSLDECAGPCSPETSAPAHHVPACVKLDLVVGYRLSTFLGHTLLQAGVSNLLDAQPPAIYDSALSYADPSYDFIGRSFFARLEQRF